MQHKNERREPYDQEAGEEDDGDPGQKNSLFLSGDRSVEKHGIMIESSTSIYSPLSLISKQDPHLTLEDA